MNTRNLITASLAALSLAACGNPPGSPPGRNNGSGGADGDGGRDRADGDGQF
ncbi:MAG: hypothetical protein IPK75_19055 [Acidobacteria bacterium]|nr:hypothetical protein [Acidobacteriota bacterium]